MTTALPHEPRRATRDTQDTVVGGVAAGLARHLAVPVLWVRAAFVVLTGLGGMGIALYAGLWLVLPTDERFREEPPGLAGATRSGLSAGRCGRRRGSAPWSAGHAGRCGRGRRSRGSWGTGRCGR